MKGISLASNPNWFLSRISSCSDNGLLAFGTRYDIVLLDTTTRPPEYKGLLTGHEGKLTSVSIAKDGSRLVSGSEDLSVRIWDVTKQTDVATFREHTSRITCVDWITGGTSDKVVSGDDNGVIIFTHVQAGKSHAYTPVKASVTVLTCDPFNYNQIGIGYKTGAIVIIDQKGTIIQKFRNHETEIQGLCWAPFIGRKFGMLVDNASEKEDHCVLSISKDNKVFVWSSMLGKSIAAFRVPTRGRQKNWRQNQDYKAPNYNTVHWPEFKQHMLICSTEGALAAYYLDIDGSVSQPHYINGGENTPVHTKPVFTLNSTGKNLFSVSMDRLICISSLSTGKVMLAIPTLGGLPFSIQFSPFDPACLAVGTGDGQVRLWKVGSDQNPYLCNSLMQGIKEKVTTIEWHPEEEGVLAVGTDEGRVGFFAMSKSFSVFSTYHKKPVNRVVWGLPCGTYPQDRSYYVFSCAGDGTILMHNPKQREKDSVNINSIIFASNPTTVKHPQRTEISWKIDTELVAIGNDDGSVEIFKAPKLEAVLIIQSHTKGIVSLKWHLSHLSTSLQRSSYSLWLAASSSESQVHVYNCTDINLNPVKDKPTEITTQVKTVLMGHGGRINSMAWSPHQDGLLATASFDGTAQVWDAMSGEPIANFRGHHGRLLDVEWCSTDPNRLFSSGADQSVQQWLISEQADTIPPKKEVKTQDRKNQLAGGSDVIEVKADGEESSQNVTTQAEPIEDGAVINQDEFSTEKVVPQKQPTAKKFKPKKPENIRRSRKKKQKSSAKSWFPISGIKENRGKQYNLQDCENLAKINCKKMNLDYRVLDAEIADQDTTHLGFFTDRLGALDILQTESTHHCSNDNWEYGFMMNVWQGNMKEVTQIAMQQQQLSDWMIALSPMISTTVWKRMCEAYAKQLIEEEEIHRAVLFLLAIHKVHDAVLLFSQHGFHKEAVTLAKVRLAPNDPTLKTCFEAWATSARTDGNIELAAKCLLGAGQPMEAARLLAQRTDPANLAAAASIALLNNNINQAVAYTKRCIQEACMRLEWKPSMDICMKIADMKRFVPLIQLHEFFCKFLYSFLYNFRTSDTTVPIVLPGDQPFLHVVAKSWESSEDNELQAILIRRSLNSYKQILSLGVCDQNARPGRHLIYCIAVELALSILATRGNRLNLAMLHLSEALRLPWETKSSSVSIGVVGLLLPHGPQQLETMFPPGFTVPEECSSTLSEMTQAWYNLALLAAVENKINKNGKQDAVELELAGCDTKNDLSSDKLIEANPPEHVNAITAADDLANLQQGFTVQGEIKGELNGDVSGDFLHSSASKECVNLPAEQRNEGNSIPIVEPNSCFGLNEITEVSIHQNVETVPKETEHQIPVRASSLKNLLQSLFKSRQQGAELLKVDGLGDCQHDESCSQDDQTVGLSKLTSVKKDDAPLAEISAQRVRELAQHVLRPHVMRYIQLQSAAIDVSFYCDSTSELDQWLQDSNAAASSLAVNQSIPESSLSDKNLKGNTEEFHYASDGTIDEFHDAIETDTSDCREEDKTSSNTAMKNVTLQCKKEDSVSIETTISEMQNMTENTQQLDQHHMTESDLSNNPDKSATLKCAVAEVVEHGEVKSIQTEHSITVVSSHSEALGTSLPDSRNGDYDNNSVSEILPPKVIQEVNPGRTAGNLETSGIENTKKDEMYNEISIDGNKLMMELVGGNKNGGTEEVLSNTGTSKEGSRIEEVSNNDQVEGEEEDLSSTIERMLGNELKSLRKERHTNVYPDPRYACALVKAICDAHTGEEWEDLKIWIEEWETEHCKDVDFNFIKVDSNSV